MIAKFLTWWQARQAERLQAYYHPRLDALRRIQKLEYRSVRRIAETKQLRLVREQRRVA